MKGRVIFLSEERLEKAPSSISVTFLPIISSSIKERLSMAPAAILFTFSGMVTVLTVSLSYFLPSGAFFVNPSASSVYFLSEIRSLAASETEYDVRVTTPSESSVVFHSYLTVVSDFLSLPQDASVAKSVAESASDKIKAIIFFILCLLDEA